MIKLNDQEKAYIKKLYLAGNSYREITKLTSYSTNHISQVVRGLRSRSESLKTSRQKGVGLLTENGRQKLIEYGQNACKRNRKFWTKPEREFRNILKEMQLGVKFPDYVKEVTGEADDENSIICYQYPVQRYVCDFVDVSRKIAFRVNGDFWHANPLLYTTLTKIQQHNVKQDNNCRIFLEKHGWSICDIWESEIYWNKEIVKQKINAAITNITATQIEITEDWSEKLKNLWFKKSREPVVKEKSVKEERKCACGNVYYILVKNKNKKHQKRKYCSNSCTASKKRKCDRPSKEELAKLIAENTWIGIGRMFGVSDNSVRKWAKRYGLI